MTAPGLTRRSLLTAAAGSGVLSAVAPGWLGATAEALGGAGPRRLALHLGDLGAGTHVVDAPLPFHLVGLQWAAPVAPRLAVRTAAAGAWAQAGATSHAPDHVASGAGAHYGDPVWTGRAQQLQLRLPAPVRGVVAHLVASPPAAGEAVAASPALAAPVLGAGPGQPPIIARGAWALSAAPPPRGGAEYGLVRMAFVHHTENPNGYASADVPAMLRAIWAFHVQVRGWRDIGYNFVVDRFGRIFEARAGGIDEPVVGAQAGGYNLVSTGAAVLGDFTAAAVSPAALSALQRLLAWKLSLHGVPTGGETTVHVNPAGAIYSRFPAGAAVSLPRIAGHRDADSTACPGDVLYGQLPEVRRRAGALAGRPLVATLSAAQTALSAPASAALSGTLAGLDGSPVPGVTIALQSRALDGAAPLETTIATLPTDAAGRFATDLSLQFSAALRVLFAGGADLPATVSAPLTVTVAPGLTLATQTPSVAVGAPVVLAGTVSPALGRVLVTVTFTPAGGGAERTSQHHLVAHGGAFSLTFNPAHPGSYRCVASTPPLLRNGAAVSPPVIVTAT